MIPIIWCSLTYWLGGQTLPYFNRGFKWLRRYLLPIGLCTFLITQGSSPIHSIIACVGLSISFHIGYGDKLAMYALSGLMMGLPSVALGNTWFALLPCLFHTVFGYLSLKFNSFNWAYVALLVGASIGITYGVASGI